LIPCVAKHLLNGVLSTTPGNFFAENTWNSFEKQLARIGALPVFTIEIWFAGLPLGVLVGAPTLQKEKRRLRVVLVRVWKWKWKWKWKWNGREDRKPRMGL
jgi:hypothetical protein